MARPLDLPRVRICIGAHHQPDCHHRQYMRQGVEEYLASDEIRDAIKAYGLPIGPGETGEIVTERLISFLNEGVRRRYDCERRPWTVGPC